MDYNDLLPLGINDDLSYSLDKVEIKNNFVVRLKIEEIKLSVQTSTHLLTSQSAKT